VKVEHLAHVPPASHLKAEHLVHVPPVSQIKAEPLSLAPQAPHIKTEPSSLAPQVPPIKTENFGLGQVVPPISAARSIFDIDSPVKTSHEPKAWSRLFGDDPATPPITSASSQASGVKVKQVSFLKSFSYFASTLRTNKLECLLVEKLFQLSPLWVWG
jgi:hypothetical protein